MASILQIPQDYVGPFKTLSELNDDQFSQLLRIVSEVKVGTTWKQFHKMMVDRYKAVPVDEDFTHAIFGFGELANIYPSNRDKMAADVAEALYQGLNETDRLGFDRAAFTERIDALLLGAADIIKSEKANRLFLSHGKLMTRSRIITDMRFVFEDELDGKAEYAMIFHSLRIDYREGTQNKQGYFAMDKNDIKRLREQLDRAIDKEKSIKENCSEAVEFIDLADYGANRE